MKAMTMDTGLPRVVTAFPGQGLLRVPGTALLLASLMAALPPTPNALAQSRFQAPKGCKGYLTVQQKSCRMSNHWTCEADAPGTAWRVDISADGPTFVAKTDTEGQWLESHELNPPKSQHLILPATDPASITELLANKLDTFDFKVKANDGSIEHVNGFDRIIDPNVVIDDEPLMQTQYLARFSDADGELKHESAGFEHVSLRHRLFFSGKGVFRQESQEIPYDHSPVRFVYPGEEGFFADKPIFGCVSGGGTDASLAGNVAVPAAAR